MCLKISCLVMTALFGSGMLNVMAPPVRAAEIMELTRERAVDIALETSYQVQLLQLGMERTRSNLEARRAGLKSRVTLTLKTPNINSSSDYKWNSTLGRDEIIHSNTQRWQADLSIRQPVILLGYPTNGYLSLNSTAYRYLQKKTDSSRIDYYNRYFVRFEQPFFTPNELKNDLESAMLDLENEELRYIENLVGIVRSTNGDFDDVFETAYKNVIYDNHVQNLQQVLGIVQGIVAEDSSRAIEMIQVQVELTNTREQLLRNQSTMRNSIVDLKQRLMLAEDDSIYVAPVMDPIIPLDIDPDQAVQNGLSLRPSLRRQAITRRRDEISLEETKGRNAFRMSLEMTYGLEKTDEEYRNLFESQDNSYSVSLNATIPIWDWGQRKANIRASELSLQQTDLRTEEQTTSIRSEILTSITNLEEYEQRVINMEENVAVSKTLTEMSLAEYQNGNTTVQDLLQVLNRQRDSELNYLDAYLGYRNSVINLMTDTYYDYERNIPVLERFLGPDNANML